MTSDEKLLLRNLLAELRAIRLRVDRQIVVVQRAIRASRKTPLKKTKTKKKAKPLKAARKKISGDPVGYAKERRALTRRLSRK